MWKALKQWLSKTNPNVTPFGIPQNPVYDLANRLHVLEIEVARLTKIVEERHHA